MNYPKKINTYCPTCKKHTEHNVRKISLKKSPAKARKLSFGQQKHLRKTRGYTSKVGRKAKPVKQSQVSVATLECTACKKKQQRPLVNSKKKVEIKDKQS